MTDTAGLLLCDDLIFASRITGVASAAGVEIRVAKSMDLLLEFAGGAPIRCVIIDLNARDLDIERTLAALRGSQPPPFVVGYGSHVDTTTLKRARDAGCDIVWPRSKFTQELETSLPTWFQARRPEG